MSDHLVLLGKYAALLAVVIGVPVLAVEGSRLVHSGDDRGAEARVAERIGATVEHKSTWPLFARPTGPLVVTSVATAGPARAGGLEVGDVIVAAGEQPLHSLADLARALRAATPGRFTVDRDGRRLQMTLPTPGRALLNAGGEAVPQAADR